MGDDSSDENVLLEKCALCVVKGSCCHYIGLPLCSDDRSALSAFKRVRPAAAVVKAVFGIKTCSDFGLREEIKPFQQARSEGGSQAMKIAVTKSARAGKQEAITAKEDFQESASEEERAERELTRVQYQKHMKDLENMKAGESLQRFKELHKEQNDGESVSSGDEAATVWAAEPRRRLEKTRRGHRESAGLRSRRRPDDDMGTRRHAHRDASGPERSDRSRRGPFILSHLMLSYLILSYPIPSYLIVYDLIVSYPIVS